MTGTEYIVVKLDFERVQTYLFAVSELKSMVGANTLLGEVLRGRLGPDGKFALFVDADGSSGTNCSAQLLADHQVPNGDNLPALAVQCGAGLPPGIDLPNLGFRDLPLSDPITPNDRRTGPAKDRDDPATAYKNGILARDGGHLNAVFSSQRAAQRFFVAAQRLAAERLPGLWIKPKFHVLKFSGNAWRLETVCVRGRRVPKEISLDAPIRDGAVFQLPQFQICQATGLVPASQEDPPGKGDEPICRAVSLKREATRRFAAGRSFDVIGLIRDRLLEALEVPDRYRADAFPAEFDKISRTGYLAVIAADGNGVGSESSRRQRECEDQSLGFFETEARLKQFFRHNRVLVRAAVQRAITETFREYVASRVQAGKKVQLPFRLLMLGGDDLLLVCDAAFGPEFLIRFTQALREPGNAAASLTIGAGMAVVKHKFPFHRSHALAEQLAGSAKRLFRESDGASGSTADWLAIAEAWHEEIKQVRRRDAVVRYQVGDPQGQCVQESLVLSCRPYPILPAPNHPEQASLQSLWTLARVVGGEETGEPMEQRAGSLRAARSQLVSLGTELEKGRRHAEWAARTVNDNKLAAVLNELHGSPLPFFQASDGVHSSRLLDFLELFELARMRQRLLKTPPGEREHE